MFTVLGAVLVAAALVGVVVHLVDSTVQGVIVAGALARPALFASVPGAIVLAVTIGWPGALIGVATVAAAASTQVSLIAHRYRRRARRRPLVGTPFSVLHANILLGEADADALVDLVGTHRPDVLTVVELTPSAHERLVDAGLVDHLPHSFVGTADGGRGTGVYSRHPLTQETRHDGYAAELLSVRVRTPAGPQPRVFAVHPVPPWPRHPGEWVRELAALGQLLAKIPVDEGPVVVAGDFNATHDHKRYRNLLRGDYRDAAVEVGAGHLATYNAQMRIPPLIAIDHVLVRDAAAVEVHTVDLPGSDHRGIRASLLL